MPFKKGHKKIEGSGKKVGHRTSESTKIKISISNKGKHIGKNIGKDNPMFGKPAWNRGIPRTPEERAKISETRKKRKLFSGDKNIFWNGGISKNRKKGILLNMPNHPFCSRKGKVFEHRIIMEKHIGRYLTPSEVVHHIDKNVNNNHISNLMLFPSQSEHSRHHFILKKSMNS